MLWQITEITADDGLIYAKRPIDDRIEWDFVVGSRFYLCAIFPLTNKKNLDELKKEKIRPILYHKDMKTFHIIPEEQRNAVFLLFPAFIEYGELIIGNQKKGNCILPKPEPLKMDVIISRWDQKKTLCKRRKNHDKKVSLKIQDDMIYKKIYYQIQNRAGVTLGVYELLAEESEVTISVFKNQEVFFYTDKNCTGVADQWPGSGTL